MIDLDKYQLGDLLSEYHRTVLIYNINLVNFKYNCYCPLLEAFYDEASYSELEKYTCFYSDIFRELKATS